MHFSFIRSIIPVMLALCPMLAAAQASSESPFSAYGFGDLQPTQQVVQASMGGVGVAQVDPYSIASINPATYAALQLPTFEGGVLIRSVILRNKDEEARNTLGQIMGISLGIPVGKGKGGIAMGIKPVSRVGYRITDRAELPDGQEVRYEYSGNGGLNRAFFGAAWSLWQRRDSLRSMERLALGANFNYVFGTTERERKAFYPTGQNFVNNRINSALVVGSPVFDVGLMWQGSMREKRNEDDRPWRYVIGASAELPMSMNARRNELVSSFRVNTVGVETTLDTVRYTEGVQGKVFLPLLWGAGVTFMNDKWMISSEVRQRDWSSARIEVDDYTLPDNVASSITYALGASWNPLGGRSGKLLGRMTYRAGVRYMEDYLVIQGDQLKEIGISFGTSLPVLALSTRSRINIGAEVGQRGTGSAEQIQEQFLNFRVGITLTPDIRERWFKKKRIE